MISVYPHEQIDVSHHLFDTTRFELAAQTRFEHRFIYEEQDFRVLCHFKGFPADLVWFRKSLFCMDHISAVSTVCSGIKRIRLSGAKKKD